jgi:hypothetical protein
MLRSVFLFPLIGNVNLASSSSIIVTLVMKAIHSSETSVLTKVTRRNIPEDIFYKVDLLA